LLGLLRLLFDRLVHFGAVAGITLATAGFTGLATRVLRFLTSAREWSSASTPLPASWGEVITRNIPLADRLTPAEGARLESLVGVFLRDVRFEGCAGLRVTEEMRVTIAAQACLLLVNLRFPWYPKLRRVLLYPDTFVPKTAPGATTQRDEVPLLGEAWSNGSVVLSWSSVQQGVNNPCDGHNVVLHEFAHVLDSSTGDTDGVPPLETGDVATWAYVLHKHYSHLLRLARRDRPTTLDHYGATNKAEFFAVATESFFEQPEKLKGEEPELYDALTRVYHQDPAAQPPVVRYGAA